MLVFPATPSFLGPPESHSHQGARHNPKSRSSSLRLSTQQLLQTKLRNDLFCAGVEASEAAPDSSSEFSSKDSEESPDGSASRLLPGNSRKGPSRLHFIAFPPSVLASENEFGKDEEESSFASLSLPESNSVPLVLLLKIIPSPFVVSISSLAEISGTST
nr:hypothetical protein Iba_chr10eCG10490 [Ipomoea batatas]